MPHLERRYVPADKEFQAWLFGVLDAVEYLRDGKVAGSKFKDLADWLESEVVEYYDQYQKLKEEQVVRREQIKRQHPAGRGVVPVSKDGIHSYSKPEANVISRPAWVGKDSGGSWWHGGSGTTGRWNRIHRSNSDAFGERSDGVDRNY